MRGFDHATILSPSFHGLRKERLAAPFVYKIRRKTPRILPEKLGAVCGTLPKTLTLFQTKICDFFYPISDLKPRRPARDRSA